jgi:ATP adenylyltransferase
MDRLCTPWRFDYVTGRKKEDGCVFCNRLECDEKENFVLHRGEHWYLIMNLYPYNGGHMLCVLNRHRAMLSDCTPEELSELGKLLSVMEGSLMETFGPEGINCGYNGGISAGAGIPEHLHVHMLPRWSGDTNFMSTIGETRVMPMTLPQSYEMLLPVVRKLVGEVK